MHELADRVKPNDNTVDDQTTIIWEIVFSHTGLCFLICVSAKHFTAMFYHMHGHLWYWHLVEIAIIICIAFYDMKKAIFHLCNHISIYLWKLPFLFSKKYSNTRIVSCDFVIHGNKCLIFMEVNDKCFLHTQHFHKEKIQTKFGEKAIHILQNWLENMVFLINPYLYC